MLTKEDIDMHAGGGAGGGGGGGQGVQPVPANSNPKWDNKQWESEKTTVHFTLS